MEHMDLLKMTPDTAKMKMNRTGPSENLNKSGLLDEEDFFDFISRFQSKRMDDQRCSLAVPPLSKPSTNHHSNQTSSSTQGNKPTQSQPLRTEIAEGFSHPFLGPDSIALIFLCPFFGPLFGPFFGPFFKTADCNSTQSKKFMHMFLANGLSVPFSVPFSGLFSVPFLMLLNWHPVISTRVFRYQSQFRTVVI